MKILNSILNKYNLARAAKDHEYFSENLANVKDVQLKIFKDLSHTLRNHHIIFQEGIDYEKFRELPISTIDEYKQLIERELHASSFSLAPNIKFFKATGDCSNGAFWIPYTKEFISQRKIAQNISYFELCNEYPEVKEFKHIEFSTDSKIGLFGIEEMGVLTIMNPLDFISYLDELLASNELGDAVKHHADFEKLLPNLKIIVCNKNGRYKTYYDKIISYFPNTLIKPAALTNNCASITIPYKDQFYLAYTSHFFEFEAVKSKEILPSWLLKRGDIVRPLITTPNGLIRYRLNEVLEVTAHDQTCPKLIYKGREDKLTLVSEIVTNGDCAEVIEGFEGSFIVGISESQDSELPYYALIKDIDTFYDPEVLESILCKNYRYEVARESKKLGPSRIFEFADPAIVYQKISKIKGIEPQIMEFDYLTHLQSDKFLNTIE